MKLPSPHLPKIKEFWYRTDRYLTLEEMGAALNLTRERIRQIAKEAGLPKRTVPDGFFKGRRLGMELRPRIMRACLTCGKEMPLIETSRIRYCSRQCAGKGKMLWPVPDEITNMPTSTDAERRAKATARSKWHYRNVVLKVPEYTARFRARQRSPEYLEYHAGWHRRRRLERTPEQREQDKLKSSAQWQKTRNDPALYAAYSERRLIAERKRRAKQKLEREKIQP